MEPATLGQQIVSIIPVIASGQEPENKTTSLSLFAYILILFFIFQRNGSCVLLNYKYLFFFFKASAIFVFPGTAFLF